MDKLSKVLESMAHRLPAGLDLSEPVDVEQMNRDADREWAERKTAILLKRIPERYRKAIPRAEASLSWLDRYAEGDRPNLAITGPAGCGKTWEASAIAGRLLRKFTPVTLIEAPELFSQLRPGDEGADLASFQATPVLVLDDLGAEKVSEWSMEQLYMILNARHNTMRPTIFTTNQTLAELNAVYGDRIFRRLAQDAMLLPLGQR